jgi:hypothetical protein
MHRANALAAGASNAFHANAKNFRCFLLLIVSSVHLLQRISNLPDAKM